MLLSCPVVLQAVRSCAGCYKATTSGPQPGSIGRARRRLMSGRSGATGGWRTIVESTDTGQSMSPAVSALA
ncbi:hypothetical protein ACFWVF_19400 [Streptomyces sp. NPDC058659]|uniref:hypothetical protein n=1 Tax=unclassified Streptomyces TaxID=2593676 RepID=UPI00365D2367